MDEDGAATRGPDAALSPLEAEVARLRAREAHHLRLLEESRRRADRTCAFMLALRALSESDTLFRRGLDGALAEIVARSRRELGVARASVWLFDETRTRLTCASLDEEGAAGARPDGEFLAAQAPGYFAAIAQDRIIAADDAHADPRTRELGDGYLSRHGITALLDAPIRAFGANVGVVCHEQVGPPRRWTNEEQSFAAAVGDLVALAVTTARRERAEGVAAASAARFRYLVESLPATVYSFQPDAPVLDYLSPQVERLTGHPPTFWLGGGELERWLGAVHPDVRAKVLSRFERAPRSEDAAEVTYRSRHRDEGWRWVRDAFRIVRNADGRPLGLQGVLQDVTDAVSARREVDELRRQVHELVERSEELVVILDYDGRILFTNEALVRLVGQPAERLRGQDWFTILVPPDERDAVREVFLQGTRAGTIVPWFENTILAADGSKRLLRWNNVVRRDTEGRVVGTASLGSDLTERLAIEARLLEAQKFESLGRLATGVAHDFNNLLTAVVGAADLLDVAVAQGQSAAASLEVIRESARRAGALIASLLGFARQRPVAPQLLALDSSVRGALGTLRALLGGTIELDATLRAPGAHVRLDPSGLDQVLLNLVVNARDAMPAGGRVQIVTEVAFVDDELARRLGAPRSGTFVTLAVRDDGVGMDEATAARVFEPFFTTKDRERARGTGLGLATSYGIVRQGGGLIAVESRPGAGSTFTVYLPRVPEAEARAGLQAAPAEAPPPEAAPAALAPGAALGPVLLVDDDPIVAWVLGEGLRRQGFAVQIAGSGAEALRLAAAATPPVRLLVTDVRLGDMDGRLLARRFRASHPEAPVVLLSGGVIPLPDAWIAAVLSKPIMPLELAARLRQLLASSGGAPPAAPSVG